MAEVFWLGNAELELDFWLGNFGMCVCVFCWGAGQIYMENHFERNS